jgi:hypothetical protein
MTPAQRLAARHAAQQRTSTGAQPMSPELAATLGEQFLRAVAADDQDGGQDAAAYLFVGMAINLARIAEHLTNQEQNR